MVVCVCLAKAEGDEENASVAELPSFTTKLWTSNMNKVIPLFCTAHPLLRITLPHPRWRRFFSVARKEQTRAAFAELKLLFAIIMSQIGRQVCYQKTRKWKKCAWSRSLQWFFTSRPSSCGIYWKVLAEALDYGGCGTALLHSDCINEPVSGLGSLLYICRSNSESGESNISGRKKIHRITRTTRGRPVNTRSAAEFTFFCVYKPNKRPYEE